jgi:hypothetical protein
MAEDTSLALGGGFQLVCRNCDGLGIAYDCAERAPASTQILCRHCGYNRGTLGELRRLAQREGPNAFGL